MELDERWIYAQQSILGSVLISPECAGKIVFGVSATDFVAQYRTIYEAIRDLYTTGKAVDPVTVLDRIGGKDQYQGLLQELMEITPTAANIDYYIGICRERSRVYQYQQMGAQLQAADSAEQAEKILVL